MIGGRGGACSADRRGARTAARRATSHGRPLGRSSRCRRSREASRCRFPPEPTSTKRYAQVAMDRLRTIRWLWEFHAWARPRLLEAASVLTSEHLTRPGAIAGGLGTGSMHEMLAHIVGAEEIWLRLWQGESELRCQRARTSPIPMRSSGGGRKLNAAASPCSTPSWMATSIARCDTSVSPVMSRSGSRFGRPCCTSRTTQRITGRTFAPHSALLATHPRASI